MAPRFGTDGVRGVANSELTPAVALALGRAAVDVLQTERLVIGRDPRRSGPMLEAALAAGACSAGTDVDLLGVVPTPTVAWVSADEGVAGAMISASHNPFADNGIKLFAPGGLKLGDDVEAEIEQRYQSLLADGFTAGPTGSDTGTVTANISTANTVTANTVTASPGQAAAEGWLRSVTGSIEQRRLDGLHIVLDCANGAASDWAADAYRSLGADVAVIGDQPDGVNINDGYGSTSPDRLVDAVTTSGADLGLAFDGDADRLIAVDETGTIVDGDRVLAILAVDWDEQQRLARSTVVVTVMTNLGFHRAMADAGIEVRTTPVGDRHVLQALDDGDLSLGGEQSGHVICRQLATTGDGILTGIQLSDAVQRAEQPLSKLAAEAMTTVPQILRNVRLAQRDDTLVERLGPEIEAVSSELGDDGRLLVRASGTEPLLRIMVEHLDREVAERTCERLIRSTEALMS